MCHGCDISRAPGCSHIAEFTLKIGQVGGLSLPTSHSRAAGLNSGEMQSKQPRPGGRGPGLPYAATRFRSSAPCVRAPDRASSGTVPGRADRRGTIKTPPPSGSSWRRAGPAVTSRRHNPWACDRIERRSLDARGPRSHLGRPVRAGTEARRWWRWAGMGDPLVGLAGQDGAARSPVPLWMATASVVGRFDGGSFCRNSLPGWAGHRAPRPGEGRGDLGRPAIMLGAGGEIVDSELVAMGRQKAPPPLG